MIVWKTHLVFLFFLLLSILDLISSEQIKIYESKQIIEFPNILTFQINFNELKNNTPTFLIDHSFLSIMVNVTNDKECTKNPNVNNILIIINSHAVS